MVYMQTIMPANEKNFLYSLGEIRKKAFSFLSREMKANGITDVPPSYGDVLYAIHSRGQVSLSDLCRLTNKDKSTVSIVINAMEKSGYVIKTRDENDGRSVCICLSDKARSYAGCMADISDRLRQQFFAGMSEEEKAIFFLLINKISSNL
jgi:DNA-binding MarR family transcriptional regulator